MDIYTKEGKKDIIKKFTPKTKKVLVKQGLSA